MAGALNHLHRAGLLHLDIKPSNIGFAAGTNPFAAPDMDQTVQRIKSGSAPDICDVFPECPAGLAQFFRLALARHLDHRPASAPEFAAALHRLASHDQPHLPMIQ